MCHPFRRPNARGFFERAITRAREARVGELACRGFSDPRESDSQGFTPPQFRPGLHCVALSGLGSGQLQKHAEHPDARDFSDRRLLALERRTWGAADHRCKKGCRTKAVVRHTPATFKAQSRSLVTVLTRKS